MICLPFSLEINPQNDRLLQLGWRKLPFWLLLISAFGLNSCAQDGRPPGSGLDSSNSRPRSGLYVAAAFGPDGRLWRVAPDKRHVYVDFSNDQGKTFSAPVVINPESQRIKTSAENRPGIAADGAGRIYVMYPAEGDKQPATLYFSVSADGGEHFSPPAAVSDEADEANTFQGRLALGPTGRAYVFWHDERDRVDWRQTGNAIYYTTLDSGAGSAAFSRKAADVVCECCKIAAAFETAGQPVLLARFVYPGGIRDHGLIKPADGSDQWTSWRVTFDDWRIEACPEHGPALSIGDDGGYHIAWFTQGHVRQGLFYAHSSDQGLHFSNPLPFGTLNKLPGHPDVIALKQRVVLVWTEFDGVKTQVLMMQSKDGGQRWSPAKAIAETASEADVPLLVHKDDEIFLSWNTGGEGYRLISI